ncbi:MAG TPA: RNA 2',3'-cyclic phosphodiesterase [Burkholderiaceae bacterium]|nr:RNA 2',3'-cyclic phosphodiesterase [Burkholderiaceae bacterium]
MERATADNVRLFVALWPDAHVRAALQAASAQWRWQPGAAIIPTERLHLTLHFLGDLPRERIPQLTRALALPSARCELTLDRTALWRGGIAVLEPSVVPAPLAELRRALDAALRALGLTLETRRWRPHLTLARRAHVKPPRLAPIVWPLRGHVLAESQLRARTSYEVVARFD